MSKTSVKYGTQVLTEIDDSNSVTFYCKDKVMEEDITVTAGTPEMIEAQLQDNKNVTQNGVVKPDGQYTGLKQVTVNVQPPLKPIFEVNTNGTVTPGSDFYGLAGVIVNVPIPDGYKIPQLTAKAITANGTYTPPIGVDGFNEVSVSVPPPAGYLLPAGNKHITANGTNIDVKDKETVSVAVPSNVQNSKSVTVTGGTSQTVYADTGFDGMKQVSVTATIPAGYKIPVLTSQTFTSNDTYLASAYGADGFSSVKVDIPEKKFTTKSITSNGTYKASESFADGFSEVTVDVTPNLQNSKGVKVEAGGDPVTINPDIGYVGMKSVSVTATIPYGYKIPAVGTKEVTENGTYVAAAENLDGYSVFTVKTPIKKFTTASFSSNGTYTASDYNVDGFSSVTVSTPVPTYKEKKITANGEYLAITDGVNGFDKVIVSTPVKKFTTLTATANTTYKASDYKVDGVSADGFSSVTVNVDPKIQDPKGVTVKAGTGVATVNPDRGYNGMKQVLVTVDPNMQDLRTVNITGGTTSTFKAEGDYIGMKEVKVTATIPSDYIKPSGNYAVTSANTVSNVDIKKCATLSVNITTYDGTGISVGTL